MKYDMHPSEYSIPLIHQRHGDDIPDLNPIEEPEKIGPKRDPLYSNTGMLLYLQYLKNFAVKRDGKMRMK